MTDPASNPSSFDRVAFITVRHMVIGIVVVIVVVAAAAFGLAMAWERDAAKWVKPGASVEDRNRDHNDCVRAFGRGWRSILGAPPEYLRDCMTRKGWRFEDRE